MAIKSGDKVKVDYEGRFEDGTIFDSSRKHEGHEHFLEFEVGAGQVIPGFENAVIGMNNGEEKEITLEPKDAYGMPDERLVHKVPIEALPQEQKPEVGAVLILGTPDGHQIPAVIKAVDDKTVTIDINHPLAGKKLIFKIKIVEVN